MKHFRLYLLGPFQAWLDGQPINDFESSKTCALLSYLAMESDRPHNREVLAEMLWPERSQGMALANLRHTLTDLRNAIGDTTAVRPRLLVTHRTLMFDRSGMASGDTFVDVTHFFVLVRRRHRS